MTEAEWLAAGQQGLNAAVGRLGPRRGRLCAVAACRAAWQEAPAAVAEALAVSERFADTGRTKVALLRARQSIRALRDLYLDKVASTAPDREQQFRVLWAAEVACSERVPHAAVFEAGCVLLARGMSYSEALRAMHSVYVDLAVSPDSTFVPAWRTAAATAIAAGCYAARDFSRLPVLADALEDAGCVAAELLAHLRGPGPHARGCWALDAVLGKG